MEHFYRMIFCFQLVTWNFLRAPWSQHSPCNIVPHCKHSFSCKLRVASIPLFQLHIIRTRTGSFYNSRIWMPYLLAKAVFCSFHSNMLRFGNCIQEPELTVCRLPFNVCKKRTSSKNYCRKTITSPLPFATFWLLLQTDRGVPKAQVDLNTRWDWYKQLLVCKFKFRGWDNKINHPSTKGGGLRNSQVNVNEIKKL